MTAVSTPIPSAADARSGWTVPGVAAVVGMIGVAAGGLGSFAAASFARGEAAQRLAVVEKRIELHEVAATRVMVIEANVASIKESVARVEQALRDERADRRNGGGK